MVMVRTLRVLSIMFILLVMLQPGFATKGIGLVYGASSVIVAENSETCIAYGVYNPWDEDVTISLAPTGALAAFTSDSSEEFVSAGTLHDEAKNTDICFKVPTVYDAKCIIGDLWCNRVCPEEKVEFTGEVVAAEVREPTTLASSGSAVRAVASAPLRMTVQCEPAKRNYISLSGLIVGVLIAVLAAIMFIQSGGQRGYLAQQDYKRNVPRMNYYYRRPR